MDSVYGALSSICAFQHETNQVGDKSEHFEIVLSSVERCCTLHNSIGTVIARQTNLSSDDVRAKSAPFTV